MDKQDTDAKQDDSTHKFNKLPEEYKKFVFTSPKELVHLRNQFEEMDSAAAKACFTSVIDVISEYEKMTPCINRTEEQPIIDTQDGVQSTEMNSYHIGLKIEDGEVTDAEVVGIYYSALDCTRERFDWVKPSLLEFDRQTLVQTLDGVIYSFAFNDLRKLTPENLASHFASNLNHEYNFFQKDEEEYHDVFNAVHKRILHPHMDGDYFYPGTESG